MERSIQSDIEYTLRTLDQGPELNQARQWAKRRRAYVHHCFDTSPARKQIGVLVGSQLVSVITVEITGEGEYLLHVTSPARSDLVLVADATYRVGWQLFDQLGAEMLLTHCPSLNGRLHRGSKALCEACHLRPYGLPEEEEINGIKYSWQVYSMTRDWWLRNEQRRKAA